MRDPAPILATALGCLAAAACVGVSCVALAGPLPVPLPLPVASGERSGAVAGAPGPWTLVNSCPLTNSLLCSGDDVSFGRASTATCDHADGTRTALASGEACHDAAWGLRVERTARTNTLLSTDTLNDAGYWSPAASGGPTGPIVTANQLDDGRGLTTCERIDIPAVSDAESFSILYQPFTGTAEPWSCGLSARGVSGSGTVYLRCGAAIGNGVACAYGTDGWTRCRAENYTLAAGTEYFVLGVDLRSGSGQSAQPAQSIYVCGPQSEAGKWASSYIPTTTAPVTRAAESATLATTGWDPAHLRITETVLWIVDPDATAVTHYLWAANNGTNGLSLDVYGGDTVARWSLSGGVDSASAAVAWAPRTSYALDEEYADDAITITRDDVEILTDASTAYWPTTLQNPATLAATGGDSGPSDHWLRDFNVYEPNP